MSSVPRSPEERVISAKLHESRQTLVCRAYRSSDGTPVVIKTLKAKTATEDERTRFHHEFELLSKIDVSGVVKVFGLEELKGVPSIVLEDIGGEDLGRLLEHATFTLPQFLALANGLAGTLAGLHRVGVIHKDIDPHHIIYNQETGEFRLIGFGLADELPQSHVALQPPAALAADLAYISPEATGRMNRPVDYRTDFYSLGAVFYRILTGRPPFQTEDSLGLVHSHIASLPTTPHEIDREIPKSVSGIVMKLLAKAAEDRYQSGAGLLADLSRCAAGETEFEPGMEDFPNRLSLPRALYGREREIGQLLASFDRACEGGRELLLVAGFAGVGKTALVHEMDRVLTQRGGHFIEGKFEQLQRSVPHFAWIQAFTGFVNYLLMESEEALARWQEVIREAVGNLGKVLTEVIPNLELVIGTQPDVPLLGGAEAMNRFGYVFLRFIGALTEEHPLVVFLDDLQWIDTASLNLLQTLLGSQNVANVLVVGAYRDNEVDAAHPLAAWISAMRGEQRTIELLTLKELSEESVNELIADTLREERGRSLPLTRRIYAKTGGNPFFLLQTLGALAERRAIMFDSDTRRWQWDMKAFEDMGITDNVVDLMLEKLRELPPDTRELLPLAACMGFRFEVGGLAVIAEQSKERVLQDLWPALRQGLLLPVERDFRFAHDRVQQAAYALLPDGERQAVHWRIGRCLLQEIVPAQRNGHLFDIVNHLNIGVSCLASPAEARELADLNRQVGSKAKAASAFPAALEYFEAGIALLGDEGWDTDYPLALQLHQEAAEASCLCGRYQRMEALLAFVRQRARTELDAVPAYRTEIRALTARGRLVPAIRCGLSALERLGMSLPEEPSAVQVNEAMARAFALLQQRTIEGLIALPAMTSPEQSASLTLLSEIGEPAYAASPHFFLVWAASMAELSLRHGNCRLSPFAYAAYALALCATGEIETGSLLSKAAIAMIDHLEAGSLRCRLLNIHGCTIQPWTEHLRDTLPTLAEAVGAGAESGDFTSASYAAFNSCTAAFFMGEPLEELSARVSANLKIIAGLRQTYIWNWVAFHVPVIRRLHGGENSPANPDGFDEASWLSAARDANDRCGIAYYFLGRLIAAYLLTDEELAETQTHIAEIQENMAGFQGAFAVPVFSFYCSLTLLKRHGRNQPENDAASLEEVRAYLARLDSLAAFAPMNFRHKCDLIAAELARIQGEDWRAAGQYEKAIAGARENGFIQEEALANELAAKFYRAHGRESSARMHLEEAHRGYGRWQALAKVRKLEAEFPQWLKRPESKQPAPEAYSLDMESVLKATHAISGEIEMGRVLGRVMRIVIENAGAQTGFLLMENGGAWSVAARGEIGGSEVEIPMPEPVGNSAAVSAGVIHFVARTRMTVVLDDAATRGDFVDDPHIRREKTRSLLAIPLSNRGRLLGILYLVNNLATHTFTKERIQLLETLAAQAAISLETAGVYETLRLNELRYRLGQTAAHIGTWEYDLRSGRFWGSAEAKRIYGLPLERSDFPEDEVEACIPERHRVHQTLLDLIEKGAPYDLEFEINPADGSEARIISSIAELYRDDRGTPLKVVGVIQDITERKRSEEEIRRLNATLEKRVAARTAELEAKNAELERMNRVFVGRELRMVELKKRIRELETQLPQAPSTGDSQ